MKLIKKSLTVEVAYFVGESEPERGIFRGGVQESPFLDELVIDPTVDEVYDESSDAFQPSGMIQFNIHGTRRAYKALAQYLLSICDLETADPGYHLHLDGIRGSDGAEAAHVILHLPRDTAE